MWTRPDQVVLEVCKYGYCIKTGTESLDLNSSTSLGVGWAYLILPILIGVMIGVIICIGITRSKKQNKVKENEYGNTRANK